MDSFYSNVHMNLNFNYIVLCGIGSFLIYVLIIRVLFDYRIIKLGKIIETYLIIRKFLRVWWKRKFHCLAIGPKGKFLHSVLYYFHIDFISVSYITFQAATPVCLELNLVWLLENSLWTDHNFICTLELYTFFTFSPRT